MSKKSEMAVTVANGDITFSINLLKKHEIKISDSVKQAQSDIAKNGNQIADKISELHKVQEEYNVSVSAAETVHASGVDTTITDNLLTQLAQERYLMKLQKNYLKAYLKYQHHCQKLAKLTIRDLRNDQRYVRNLIATRYMRGMH